MKHYKYNKIKNLLNIKKNVGLYGEAGSGKSYLLEQIAQELNKPFYGFTCGPTTRYDDIIGYNDIHGKGIPSALGNMCDKPGIFSFEEIDLLNSKVQNQLNDLLQARRLKNHDGQIHNFHPDFIICATGNTKGEGESNQYTRNFSDRSLASRFGFEKIEIDEEIEYNLSGQNKILHNLIKEIRKEADALELSNIILTPRQTKDLADLLHICNPHDIFQDFFLELPNFDEIRQNTKVEKYLKLFINLPSEIPTIFTKEKDPEQEEDKGENNDQDQQNQNNNQDLRNQNDSTNPFQNPSCQNQQNKQNSNAEIKDQYINKKSQQKKTSFTEDLLKDLGNKTLKIIGLKERK